MQQPKMQILKTWEIYKVISLNWLDKWETLRAFPLRDIPDRDEPMSYVIVKWEWEQTDVNAILIV